MKIEQRRVFPGESLIVTLTVSNTGFLPLSFEVHCPFGGGLRSLYADEPLTSDNTLVWFQSLEEEWELRAARRGVFHIGPATTNTGDPLGFFMTSRTVDEQFEIVVYPRLVALHPIVLPKRDFFGTPGGESPVDDPIYILGTIDYHHGRPARHIHWKASARHNRLQQKVFEPTEQEKILVIVDVTDFEDQSRAEAFEETLEAVASLSARLDAHGSAIGFLTNGLVPRGSNFLSITRNPFQITAILETLARLQTTRQMPVFDVLQSIPAIPWGTTCIYFTFEKSHETALTLASLSRRRTPVVVITYESVLELMDENAHRQDKHLESEWEVREAVT